ncbi:hypothetical protein [Hydrogenimonas sp.]
MQQLEAFFESTPKAVGFTKRKIEIPLHTFNLYGPPKSGKTWAVLDYLSRMPKKRHLYIDLADLRVDRHTLLEELQSFIDRHRIEVVVFDHCDDPFPIPVCRQSIFVGRRPLRETSLPTLELPPLDFEEYLLFEKGSLHLEHSFSRYLRTGSLPLMTSVHESLLTMRLHETVRSIFPLPNERLLFRYMARFTGKPVTPHQLYTAMKREHKVSKDWLYRTIKSWEERRILAWLPRYEQPGAAKRLLFFDFALPASMYFERSLMGQLYSIAARRLLRRYPRTVFTDKLDFLEPQTSRAILLSPFANPQSAAVKVAALAHELDRFPIGKIVILTVSNRFEFMFETIPVEAKPFYAWMLEEE